MARKMLLVCICVLLSFANCDKKKEKENLEKVKKAFEEMKDTNDIPLISREETDQNFHLLDKNGDNFLDHSEIRELAKMTFGADGAEADSFADKVLDTNMKERLSPDDLYNFYLRAYNENRQSHYPPEMEDDRPTISDREDL